MRLLVVEDEPDLAEALARGLRRDGHAVDVALTAADADFKLRTAGYDLVCLDWNLPDGSGLELCRNLVTGDLETFETDRPRLLMLTARDDIADRVAGLDSGADDYLVKPFAFAELSARVRALLRREAEVDPVLNVGPLSMNPARFEVTRDGEGLALTSKEFSLLNYFMTRPGEVLSQEHLLEHVWDEMADPMTNVVRVTLSNLRKKIGEPQLIETVAGRGYRLLEP
ncbi:MAG: response regulator transcription factor [Acidimicrobiia bacterium]|nr:response regulator transcription factor [Acidimicrobiia bacterium]MDH3462477.1 response regulator transcription factor [Acidimicrobiia bacterium]